MSLMKQIDNGVISSDSKLSHIISNLPSWADSISMLHLVNNASGLPQLSFKTVKNEEDLFTNLRNTQKLDAQPGSVYLYNHNIPILIKRIIEVTSGQTMKGFIQNNFLDFLKMNETIFDPSASHPNLAISFNSSFQNDTPYNPFEGWVYTTTDDLMKWLVATHDGSLVNESSYQLLTENQFFSDRLSGLGEKGTTKNGHTIYHWGGYFNYLSLTYVNFEKELFIVLLSNNGCRELLNMAQKIDSLISK